MSEWILIVMFYGSSMSTVAIDVDSWFQCQQVYSFLAGDMKTKGVNEPRFFTCIKRMPLPKWEPPTESKP